MINTNINKKDQQTTGLIKRLNKNMKLVDWFYCLRDVASSVPKGSKCGFVTYRHHVMQQAKLQLVVKYCFWLVMFYPIKICS